MTRLQGRMAAILLGLALPLQAPADPERRVTFELEFAGIAAGVVEVEIARDGDRYSATARGRPSDWLDGLYSARLTAEGEGRADPSPRPDRFATNLRFGDDAQQVEVAWNADGAPSRVEATPAFRPKPWQIDPAEQGGTADPLSLAVRLLEGRAPEALCDETEDIFDGRRRSRVRLGEASPFKGGWRCLGDWRRVAGYSPESMEAEPTEIRAYFVPFADGLAHLSKLEVITRWGTGIARRAP
ncbi:MAG: DUF3108 domain-containing protein [Pseudomonadota bacterium]